MAAVRVRDARGVEFDETLGVPETWDGHVDGLSRLECPTAHRQLRRVGVRLDRIRVTPRGGRSEPVGRLVRADEVRDAAVGRIRKPGRSTLLQFVPDALAEFLLVHVVFGTSGAEVIKRRFARRPTRRVRTAEGYSRSGYVPVTMLELDGSEGGGQLVRTALACAALTGESFRMTEVRGGRPNPGLRPQHLAAVRAVAAVCDAEVTGAAEGSESLAFTPGPPAGGEYEVAVGTAGSVPLVFDAVLPVAYALAEPLELRATGGTDVKWAPTADHQGQIKLPLVRRAGLVAKIALERRGFYPAGGGRATLSLAPSAPCELELEDRGRLESVTVSSVASLSLEDRDVAERQAESAIEALDVPEPVESRIEYVESASPGSAVLVRAEYGDSLAGFDSLGERGRPAEEVGVAAAGAFGQFDASEAAVDEHTADQLVLPLAVAGGHVTIPRVTDHVATNVEVLRAFGADVRVVDGDEGDGPPRVVAAGDLR